MFHNSIRILPAPHSPCNHSIQHGWENLLGGRTQVRDGGGNEEVEDNLQWTAAVSLSVCLYVWLSVCVSVCLAVCISVCLSACLSACLSVCLSVYPSIYPSVCWLAGLSIFFSFPSLFYSPSPSLSLSLFSFIIYSSSLYLSLFLQCIHSWSLSSYVSIILSQSNPLFFPFSLPSPPPLSLSHIFFRVHTLQN